MKITKTINLSAYSTISIQQENGTTVDTSIASFSATISDNYTSSQLTIQDQELYNSNKVLVRKDKSDFDNYVYNIQDTLFATEEATTDDSADGSTT